MPKYILDGQLDIEPLINARNFLKKALQEAESELEIAGAIKAFEKPFVDQETHYLVADILNKILPLPNLRKKENLDLEKDADYRELFFAYENNYQGQEKNLNSESLTQEIAYEYLLLVIRSLARNLADFPCHLP
ncbi:14803_t:CDS:2, partial [Gigaspora margarita]